MGRGGVRGRRRRLRAGGGKEGSGGLRTCVRLCGGAGGVPPPFPRRRPALRGGLALGYLR